MKPKRILMIGTMAVAITIGGGIWNKEAGAENTLPSPEPSCGSWGTKDTVQEQAQTQEQVQSQAQIQTQTQPQTQEPANAPDSFLQLLGLSSNEQMYDSIYEGHSLSDIARNRDKDVIPIVELQIAELTEQLDMRLAAGHITPEIHAMQKLEVPDIIARSVYGG